MGRDPRSAQALGYKIESKAALAADQEHQGVDDRRQGFFAPRCNAGRVHRRLVHPRLVLGVQHRVRCLQLMQQLMNSRVH
ncbi:hypothetical protein HP453_09070 [Glutamicibacter halophytocola]|nr:hypothetical protein [Glutamicibacter halophytocola]